MARFWLATLAFQRPVALIPPPSPVRARFWAIEIIFDEAINEYAVLLSTVDDAGQPAKLMCQLGFANGAKSCNVWRDRGFPLVDAIIRVSSDKSELAICAPCFLEPDEMHYEATLISIKNIMLVNNLGTSAELSIPYEQQLQVPESAFPATRLDEKTVTWLPQRSRVKEIKKAELQFSWGSRWPSLAPLGQAGLKPNKIWSGMIKLPEWHTGSRRDPILRESRRRLFGEAEFRFEDVEVLGFRIDLTKVCPGDKKHIDEGLAKLVKPLNFHLGPAAGPHASATRSALSDFQYRPASRTLMLELLHYGKMKLKADTPPLAGKDFQSQHELALRINVGRVDDDTSQARDAATFVPAIFVDNPWSKVLGRAVQGFDKRLADFCILHNGNARRLLPNGLLSADDKERQPLGKIAQIGLVKRSGGEPNGQLLLELDCPHREFDEDAFIRVNPRFVFNSFPFPVHWRQTDFDEAQFRRSFARAVVTKTRYGFRSIQVSPICEHKLRQELRAETAWLTGTFNFRDDVSFARPNGTVSLTFHAAEDAPAAWKELCKLLGINDGGNGCISLPGGSWYRIRCAMDFTGDNGLDWYAGQAWAL